MILLVASSKDTAGMNIAKHILRLHPFRKNTENFQSNPTYSAEINGREVTFITLKQETIDAQDLPDTFANPQLIVFISKHRSASGTPTLSVHTPGNLGPADMGGLPRKVSVSPANSMRDALKALALSKEKMKLDYEVSYECTHHGPSLNVPAMFVELGSSEKQWNDQHAAEAVAHAAMDAIAKFHHSKSHAALGIGGPHYNRQFTRMTIDGNQLFGHIIPKYAFKIIDTEILSQCVEKTLEKVEYAVLDWKGIRSDDKSKLLEMLKEIGLQYRKA